MCNAKNIENLADIANVTIDPNLSQSERYTEYCRQLNGNPHDYICCGIVIHETFDIDGPQFDECVVRIFND
jgi:hypothetical protein